jgi:hypothetical protein
MDAERYLRSVLDKDLALLAVAEVSAAALEAAVDEDRRQ